MITFIILISQFLIINQLWEALSKFNQYCNCRFHTHRTTRVPGSPVSRKVLGRCSGRTEIGFHFSSSLMSNEFLEMITCYQVPRQLERRPAWGKRGISGQNSLLDMELVTFQLSKKHLVPQWANGNKFVGEFQAGLPAGEGVYETKSGDIFVGRL